MTPFNALPSPAIIAALWKSPAWVTAAVLLGLVVGFAFFGASPAHAQEERYVDLAVVLEFWGDEDGQRPRDNSRTNLYARNLGNQTAYDVEVEFEPVEHTPSTTPVDTRIIQTWPTGSIDPQPHMVTGAMSSNDFKWTIPALPAHTQYRLVIDRTPGDGGLHPRVFAYSATIKSTKSHESPARMDNNSARAWETWAFGTTAYAAQPDYWVQISVDNRRPQPGDTVNFTVTASRGSKPLSGGPTYYSEGCINVWLTSGLMADTPTFDPAVFTGLAYNTSSTRS